MKKLALTVTLLLIVAMQLQADENEMSLFTQLDTDKDNLISKEEAKRVEKIYAMFEALDADADGQLSVSEFEAQVKAKLPVVVNSDTPN